MGDLLHEELIRQAIEAAQAGKRDEALNNLKEVLLEDEENTTAWLLLARITENDDEKRIALKTILALEPDNEKARALLDKLEGKVDKTVGHSDDLIPGVSRRTVYIIGAAIGGVITGLIAMLFIVNSSQNAEEQRQQQLVADANATSMQIVLNQTQVVIDGQNTAVAATQTMIALVSPTPLPRTIPTLPPTNTPIPTPTAFIETVLPAPTGLTGYLLAWGGVNFGGGEVLPLLAFNFADGLVPQTLGSEAGRTPLLIDNRQTILFERYIDRRASSEIGLMDREGNSLPFNADRQTENITVDNEHHPLLSFDAMQVIYVGFSLETQQWEVLLLDLTTEQVGEIPVYPLRQLTRSSGSYSWPALSPDGAKVIAARENLDDGSVELYEIDVTSRNILPYTFDGAAVTETMPRWSPDGTQIVYAALAQGETNHDLYMMQAASPGTGVKIEGIDDDNAYDELYPVYSPDGRYLAFASNRSGSYQIYILDLTEGELFQLTNARGNHYPTLWSDGNLNQP